MDDTGESKRYFEMEIEVQNDGDDFPKASASNDVEGTSQDKNVSESSQICTENLLKDAFSNLNLNIDKESDSCEEELLQIPVSTEKNGSKLMFTNPPLGKGESIYNLWRSFNNPVTGIVTKIGAEGVPPQVSTGCERDNASTAAFAVENKKVTSNIAGDGTSKKVIKFQKNINPKSGDTRRNPITGDGIEQMENCTLISNTRIGIRVTQPAGGRSSIIF